ncbi:RNA polymerase sigma factor [Qipengyuania sp. DSG2-2]|uniref:RNA polymerase sigma factor n=1 Tax=Qipengyuania sp. DGS2-2 TaxID=3349631 RepID=UPI0036D3C1CD
MQARAQAHRRRRRPITQRQSASLLVDEFLVASAQSGDRAAWNQLAQKWEAKLVSHAYRLLGDKEAARDAAQSAWGEIVRGLTGLQDARVFPAWAYRITSRCCAKQIDRAVRDRALKSDFAAEPRDVASEPDAPSQLARLQAAIRQLPAGERAAIALYHFEEMRVAEVGVALDVPVGTVKTRLMNARRKLRAILEGEQP